MALIQAKNLHKTYMLGKLELHVLKGVSVSIERGEYICIMGPSGSGKSTLMHILGCLDKPTRGEYYLDGQAIHQLDEHSLAFIRRDKVGFVFQNFFLLPRMNALDNVALPMMYKGTPRKIRRERARQLLQEVGLGQRVEHKPMELSGGERQRVAIARALANDPEVLFADEPTGNLDTKTGDEILDLFDKLHQQGKTIVMVTHDPEVAQRAQRLIKIRDGLITE